MTYKYLDNAVKTIEYYLNSAYSHGYSDGEEDAKNRIFKARESCQNRNPQ